MAQSQQQKIKNAQRKLQHNTTQPNITSPQHQLQ